MSSLAKWMQRAGKALPEVGAWVAEHKAPIAAGAALAGGAVAAKPIAENIAAKLAMEKMKRDLRNSAADTVEFASDHPYITGAALSGASALGAASHGEGMSGILSNLIGGMGATDDQARRRRR